MKGLTEELFVVLQGKGYLIQRKKLSPGDEIFYTNTIVMVG